jgi:hypothetical protein
MLFTSRSVVLFPLLVTPAYQRTWCRARMQEERRDEFAEYVCQRVLPLLEVSAKADVAGSPDRVKGLLVHRRPASG